MKARNIAVAVLLAVGIALYSAISLVVIPRGEAASSAYAAAQLEPTTHDLGSILKYKSRYMGDFSNTCNLFYHLPLSGAGLHFRLYPDSLGLEVDYGKSCAELGGARVEKALIYDSTAAFALIGNLKSIDYRFPDRDLKVGRADVEDLYPDFSRLLDADAWRRDVQKPLENQSYVKSAAKKVLKPSPVPAAA